MARYKITLYKGKALSDGSYPLSIRLRHKDKSKLVSLGLSFKLEQWDEIRQRPKQATPQVLSLINRKERLALDGLIYLQESGSFSLENWAAYIKGENKALVFPFWDSVILSEKRAGKDSNAQIYQTAKNAFFNFAPSDLDFKDISPALLSKFARDLYARGLRVNSVGNYLRTLRAIVNKAISEEIISRETYPFDRFKIPRENTAKRALSKESVLKLWSFEPTTEGAQKAKDLFFLSLFTRGANLADLLELKEGSIREGRIYYRRKKTGAPLTIKLTPEIKRILTKYKGPGGFVLPVLKERDSVKQKKDKASNIGRRLKTYAKGAGVPGLTFYAARHTWATTARDIGVSREVIRQALGHGGGQVVDDYLNTIPESEVDKANNRVIKHLLNNPNRSDDSRYPFN